MSLVIKGMKMPKSCDECQFCNDDGICAALQIDLLGVGEELENSWYIPEGYKSDRCPLIELPAHGDLIEKDLALAIVKVPATTEAEFIEKMRMVQAMIDAPVVIPAERSWDQFHPFADSVKMGERSESADKCTKCKYYDSETYSCNDAWLPEGVCPFVERSER